MAEERNYVDIINTAAFAKTPRDRLIMGALGLGGEAGEVLEIVKKHVYHGKELNLEDLQEELGDVLWYVGLLCGVTGNTLRGLAFANIWKLKQRYPDLYPDPSTEVVVKV